MSANTLGQSPLPLTSGLATPGETRLWYEVVIHTFTPSDEGGSRAVPSSTGAFQTSRILTIAGVRAAHDTYTVFLPPLLQAFISTLALGSAADLPGLRMAFAAGAIVPLLGLPFVAPLYRGNL